MGHKVRPTLLTITLLLVLALSSYSDLTAGRIIDNVIKPRFKAGDFDRGFTGGISSIIAATRGEFSAAKKSADRSAELTGTKWRFEPGFFLIGIFFSGVALLASHKIYQFTSGSIATVSCAFSLYDLNTTGLIIAAVIGIFMRSLIIMIFLKIGTKMAEFGETPRIDAIILTGLRYLMCGVLFTVPIFHILRVLGLPLSWSSLLIIFHWIKNNLLTFIGLAAFTGLLYKFAALIVRARRGGGSGGSSGGSGFSGGGGSFGGGGASGSW